MLLILCILMAGIYMSALGRALVARDVQIVTTGTRPDWFTTYFVVPVGELMYGGLDYLVGIRYCLEESYREAIVEMQCTPEEGEAEDEAGPQ